MKQWIALLLLCGQVVAPTTGLECSSTHHPEEQAEAHHDTSGIHAEHSQVRSADLTSQPDRDHQHDGDSPCIMTGSCGTVSANVAAVELAVPFSTFALEAAVHTHAYANPSLAANTPPPRAAA
jgi:hypothetical protein